MWRGQRWPASAGGTAQQTGSATVAAEAGPNTDTATDTDQVALVALAVAFNAAWNRHDRVAVPTFFAPDALVREPGYVDDPGVGGETARYVYGAALATFPGTPPLLVEGTDVVWRGRQGVREWARRLFQSRHRAEATGHRAIAVGSSGSSGASDANGASGTGRVDTVTWRYRAHVDPYQTVAGVPPVEGTATATFRAGRITVLALAAAPWSTNQRDAALFVVGAASAATQPAGSAPVFTAPQAFGTPPPGPASTEFGWPFAAAGLGAAALILSVARQRARRARSS